MRFDYEEHLDDYFPYWFIICDPRNKLSFDSMSISDYVINNFGPSGILWNHKITNEIGSVQLSNKSFNLPIRKFCWMFKNKSDAMMFKLIWDNNE